MSSHKIIFPTDFSKCSDAALSQATSLARERGDTLVIVHVEEPPLAYGGGEMYYGLPEPDTEGLKQMLERLGPADANVPCERRLITGSPATAICDLAKEEDADMIVMGTHGRTGFSRLLMGSVAEDVMRHAQCPVVTVRHPHEAAAT